MKDRRNEFWNGWAGKVIKVEVITNAGDGNRTRMSEVVQVAFARRTIHPSPFYP